MSFGDSLDFTNDLAKLQLHDPETVREFVAHYEPYIRRAIRNRIQNAALQAIADSVDICNSVFGGFFLRLAAGGYDLSSKVDLRNLLLTIAKKKFLTLNRRESAAKRDHHSRQSMHSLPELVRSKNDSASASVEVVELLQKVDERMTSEECDLLNRRRQGQAWNDIAEEVGIDAVLLRKRLSRAIRRVADKLGIDL